MSARKRIRRFLEAPSIHPQARPEELLHRRWLPGDKTVDLRVSDLQALLRSERAARKVARRVISEKLELQRAAQRNKDAFLRERAERLRRGQEISELQTENADLRNRLAASVPALRRLVEERGQKNRELTAERDRWKRTADSRNADLRTLTAERDALQRALNKSVRKGTPPPRTFADILREFPPPFASGLSAEELRKVAQDLLPQFLATFLSPPWDKT